jgi:hypothetical protein
MLKARMVDSRGDWACAAYVRGGGCTVEVEDEEQHKAEMRTMQKGFGLLSASALDWAERFWRYSMCEKCADKTEKEMKVKKVVA